MTLPRREIIGKFTENFEYTVNGEPLSHPVWAPKKPNPQWTILPNKDLTAAYQQVSQQRNQVLLRRHHG